MQELDQGELTKADFSAAKQFSTDLASRKSSIKLMIQDELTKLADEADDEDDGDDGDAEKNEVQPAGKEVEV